MKRFKFERHEWSDLYILCNYRALYYIVIGGACARGSGVVCQRHLAAALGTYSLCTIESN